MGQWWTEVVRPYDGKLPPPPWPVKDSRTESCPHLWDEVWGVKGERQRLCVFCQRYVWEHCWTDQAQDQ